MEFWVLYKREQSKTCFHLLRHRQNHDCKVVKMANKWLFLFGKDLFIFAPITTAASKSIDL